LWSIYGKIMVPKNCTLTATERELKLTSSKVLIISLSLNS
jgi:hypothetical protein